ncbi:MAG: hypothetical protein FJ109_05505 [Deltaproteobacteria bacterium]|nr:hypothetical protein [Deltaproteobacteria bacterium]
MLMVRMATAAVLLFGATAMAQPMPTGTQWRTPGDACVGLALSDGVLWAADRKAGTVVALDPDSGEVGRTVKLPCREPGGLAAAPGRLWCTEVVQGLLFEIDSASGRTVLRMEAPCDYPGAVTYADGLLWVHCPFEKKISVTDPADGTTVRWLPALSKRMSALGSRETAGTSGRSEGESRAERGKAGGGTTGKSTTGTGKTGSGAGKGAGAGPGSGIVLAADREKDRIYFLESGGGAVTAVLPLDSPFVTGLAFDGRRLFVSDYMADRIRVIDLDAVPAYTIEAEKTERVAFRHHVLSGGPTVLTDIDVWVALPEDRPTQKILALRPLPEGAVPQEAVDNQGQRFWKFHVDEQAAGTEAVFGFEADVTIRQVRWFTDPRRKASAGDIPKDVRERYLADASKYRIDDPKVVETVRAIAGDETNLHRLFYRTYRWVLDNMDYNLAGGWNAAPLLIERKTGSCSEYTILLVSLLRAAGIPARYVGSVVMRGEPASVDLVFHRWAEVYLPGLGWLPVDANRGDAEWPADQADGYGFQDGVFLITTTGGGDSDILGWGYNSVAHYKQDGAAEVREWTSAEWEPLEAPAEEPPKGEEKLQCP